MSTPSPRPIDPTSPPSPLPPPPRPARPTNPRWLWIAGGLLLLALAWRWWDGAEGDGPIEYLTAPVDRGTIEQTITATGTVNPVKTVQVGTYVSGVIQAISCDYNTPVKAGQLCAKIDPRPFQVVVDQSNANLSSARAQLARTKLPPGPTVVYDRDSAAQAWRRSRRETVDTDKSNVDQARGADRARRSLDPAGRGGALDDAQREPRLHRHRLAGRRRRRLAERRRRPDGGRQLPDAHVVPDRRGPDQDAGRYATSASPTWAKPASASRRRSRVDAYPGCLPRAVVAQVRKAPISVQNVVTYDVVIGVDNPKLELIPGMTANVTITTAKRDDALRVPVRALRFKPETPGTKPPAT